VGPFVAPLSLLSLDWYISLSNRGFQPFSFTAISFGVKETFLLLFDFFFVTFFLRAPSHDPPDRRRPELIHPVRDTLSMYFFRTSVFSPRSLPPGPRVTVIATDDDGSITFFVFFFPFPFRCCCSFLTGLLFYFGNLSNKWATNSVRSPCLFTFYPR